MQIVSIPYHPAKVSLLFFFCFFSFTITVSYLHIWAYFHDPQINLPLLFIPKLGPEKHNHCLQLVFMIANKEFSFSRQSVPFSIEKWILLVLSGICSQGIPSLLPLECIPFSSPVIFVTLFFNFTWNLAVPWFYFENEIIFLFFFLLIQFGWLPEID